MNIFSQKIVGIDFHDYSANLVELKLKGKTISLESYNRVPMPPDVIKNGEINKEEDLKAILIKLLERSNPKPTSSKDVAIIFPSSKVFTHIFTFPANLNENEIRKAILYEAETVIPFSINDVYWDFIVLEKEGKDKKHASQYILFACITKKTADQYGSVFESIGLTPFLFGIHAEILRYAMFRQLNEEPSLIIDVGVLSINYLIVENGNIKYFFSSNRSGKKLISDISKDLQASENSIFEKKEKNKLTDTAKIPQIKKFIEENYKEAKRIIAQYATNKSSIEKIILTGEFLNLPEFYQLAKIYFPDQEIIIGDPKIGLYVDDKKFLPVEGSKESPVPYSMYFTNTIGISLRGLIGNSRNGINLLPEHLKESFSSRRNFLLIAAAAISMAVISLLASTFLFFKYQTFIYARANLEIKRSSVEKMIYGSRYQEIRDEINKFNNEINILSTIDQGLFSVPIFLEDIKNLLPKGIEITSVEFMDSDLSFSITGIADERSNLLEMQKKLGEAEFISEVFAPISNYDEKYQLSFLIKIKLNFSKLPRYGSNTNT